MLKNVIFFNNCLWYCKSNWKFRVWIRKKSSLGSSFYLNAEYDRQLESKHKSHSCKWVYVRKDNRNLMPNSVTSIWVGKITSSKNHEKPKKIRKNGKSKINIFIKKYKISKKWHKCFSLILIFSFLGISEKFMNG